MLAKQAQKKEDNTMQALALGICTTPHACLEGCTALQALTCPLLRGMHPVHLTAPSMQVFRNIDRDAKRSKCEALDLTSYVCIACRK